MAIDVFRMPDRGKADMREKRLLLDAGVKETAQSFARRGLARLFVNERLRQAHTVCVREAGESPPVRILLGVREEFAQDRVERTALFRGYPQHVSPDEKWERF